ncbi:hypothetical protein [Lacrimispora indolis]|uniref:hypothetical protein n=1 Tax=Lacrimispora indolis TaxID=69825 RepID=UPI0003FCED91|nr:hypothetical protein [[Clostridium] methoxybenzovorans]
MGYYDDYDEEFEPEEEEMEEADGMSNTKVENQGEVLKVEFDTINFAQGIINTVVSNLKEQLKSEVMREIKGIILEDIQSDIKGSVVKITEELVREIYENEVIRIGGGWNEEPKEYTIKQFIMEQIKDSFRDGEVKIKRKDRYGDWRTDKVSFTDWVTSECVTGEVQKHVDEQMKSVRDEINRKVKKIFDESTRSMLSENVMSILLANDTYRKIENSIACIASKSDSE